MSKKILMFAGDYTEDYEIMVPFQTLEVLGFKVDIASPGKKSGETIQTAVHGFKEKEQTYYEVPGHVFTLNYTFDDIKIEEYAGLYIPGGRSPEYLRLNAKVVEYTNYFISKKLPLCVVCHGSLILAATKNIKGRKLSGFYTTKPDIESVGGVYTPGDAVTDGNIVSGETYMSHVPLLKAFLAMLK